MSSSRRSRTGTPKRHPRDLENSSRPHATPRDLTATSRDLDATSTRPRPDPDPDMTRPDPGRDPKSSMDFADLGVHPRISPRPGSEPSSSLETQNLARDSVIILTCHLLHYDCMTRTDDITDDISGLG